MLRGCIEGYYSDAQEKFDENWKCKIDITVILAVGSLACCTLSWATSMLFVAIIECQCLHVVIRRCLRTPCLLAGIGMGSTLPLNGIGTSTHAQLNQQLSFDCPVSLSPAWRLVLSRNSLVNLSRPTLAPVLFSSRPQTPFPARDKLQYPRQRPIASSPTNPTAVLLQG